jgi:hypothetical protein
MTDEAFDYFLTGGIPDLVAVMVEIQKFAADLQMQAVSRSAATLLRGLLDAVNLAGVKYAVLADATIIRVLIETRSGNRPFTGNLESHIHSVPGPYGSVQVALIAELDKAVNPVGGYGPFWRAQEYGTGTAEVPGQEGRYFRGFFEPGGDVPRAAMRGRGVGTDLAFVSDATGGFGQISVELPGRHFLRDGSIEAGAKYLEGMAAIQKEYLGKMRELRSLIRAQPRGPGLTMTLHS